MKKKKVSLETFLGFRLCMRVRVCVVGTGDLNPGCMLGKHTTTELFPQPRKYHLNLKVLQARNAIVSTGLWNPYLHMKTENQTRLS